MRRCEPTWSGDVNTNLDPMLDRSAVKDATTLSFPTIHRMQRRGEFPPFEKISPGRVGLRRSVLQEFLDGRRDWNSEAIATRGENV